MCTRVCGQCVHAYEQSVCPCIHPAGHFVYLTYMYMFKYVCPPVGLMPCLCVRPSIYLTAYIHAYVEVCASVHSSLHPFVCIYEWFILACVRECLWAWVSKFVCPIRSSIRLYEQIDEHTNNPGGGRVVRRCWVNFQCRGVLLIWIRVGQGPIVLAVSAVGSCLDNFLSSITSLFFLPLSGRRSGID